MNFFHKHMQFSGSKSVGFEDIHDAGKLGERSCHTPSHRTGYGQKSTTALLQSQQYRNQEFQTPPIRPSRAHLGNGHPLAESTPVSSITAMKSQNDEGKISMRASSIAIQPAQKTSPTKRPSNVDQIPGALLENASLLKTDAVAEPAHPKKANNEKDSTESQMEMLYQSLQSEAQKIQKFKVHALAQIKQKSDEISLKESQIKKLSIELSSTRATNNQLSSKLQRQKRNNEDIMNKVATTREMCFALANEHLALKEKLELGKTIFIETQEKSSKHSVTVKRTLECVDQFKTNTEQRLCHIEETAKLQKKQQDVKIEEFFKKEKLLINQVEEKVVEYEKLQAICDERFELLSSLEKDLTNEKENSKAKEAELVAAMNELSISKDGELSAIQQTLQETIASSDSVKQDLLQDLSNVKEQLAQCQSELVAAQENLRSEAARYEVITSEKAICEDKLAQNEAMIAELVLSKSELGKSLQLAKSELDEMARDLEAVKVNLEKERLDGEEIKVQLNKEIAGNHEEIGQRLSTIRDLESEIIKLTTSLAESKAKSEKIEIDYNSLNTLLEKRDAELAARSELVDSKSIEIEKLNKILEQTSLDANADQSSMKELITSLTDEHRMEKESHLQKIHKLELDLKNSKLETEALNKKHVDVQTQNAEDLSALRQSIKSQQHEFESTIKQKTDAFTKVQDELQRMLDETTTSNKKKCSAMEEEMLARKQEHESLIELKTEEFIVEKNGLKTMLSEAEKKLELESQKVEDLTQDLAITKQSLDKSLNDKNTVASALAKKTEEWQDVSNKLLVKDCEFSKLMSAVQNLKSRWAAVATPMTPVATPTIAPQQVTVKPTAHGTPRLLNPTSPASVTPTTKSVTPIKGRLGLTTPQKNNSIIHNTTPKSAGSLTRPTCFSTPRTPNPSQDNPKGILRSEGSASKPNRVVFSTPIEQRNIPSDSDTSVLDIEIVNKSLQLKLTPEGKNVNLSRSSAGSSMNTPRKGMTTLGRSGSNQSAVTPFNQQPLNSSISPALSSQGGGDRLPRSKMLKPNGKKRVRPTGVVGKRDEFGMLARTMKKHKAMMDVGRQVSAAKPIRESDSDCFGFGSE